MSADEIRLEPAGPETAPLLANLLELYMHDLSAVFGIEIGADGRFGYDNLPRYWAEPDTRFPFLIRSGPRPAGFALVTRGSPATDDPADLDVAEFFVLRACRRAGVGRRAASLLWNRMPGRWVVRVSQGNGPALGFWRDAVRAHVDDAFTETERPGDPHGWSVLRFESGGVTPRRA